MRENKSIKLSNDEKVPLIIIPSLIGSQLHSKLNKPHSKHFYCKKKTDKWILEWLDELKLIVPFEKDCFLENIQLNYNKTSHRYQNYPGVSIKTFDRGGVSAVEYIDKFKKAAIYVELIRVLKDLGYTVGKDLRSFPYDWRYTAGTKDILYHYADLQKLIEETYVLNNNKKIAFTSLSMGGPWFITFLTKFVSQEWKDKYVHSFTSFCSPFAGSARAMKAIATLGPIEEMGHKIPGSFVQPFAKLIPAMNWMLPANHFYKNKVFISTPSHNYTSSVEDYVKLFTKLKDQQNVDIVSFLEPWRKFEAPKIKYNCVHSTNISTIAGFKYPTDDLTNKKMEEIFENGDSTVLYDSLNYCKNFKNQQTQEMNVIEIPNIEHGMDFFNPSCLKLLIETLEI